MDNFTLEFLRNLFGMDVTNIIVSMVSKMYFKEWKEQSVLLNRDYYRHISWVENHNTEFIALQWRNGTETFGDISLFWDDFSSREYNHRHEDSDIIDLRKG